MVRIEPRPTEERGRQDVRQNPTRNLEKATDVWTEKNNGTDDDVFDWEGWVRR